LHPDSFREDSSDKPSIAEMDQVALLLDTSKHFGFTVDLASWGGEKNGAPPGAANGPMDERTIEADAKHNAVQQPLALLF
jgi:hypothetical protein